MRLKSILTLLGPFVALAVIYCIFGLLEPAMFGSVAVRGILDQTVIVGVAAVGMTLIIVSGGIDLSTGSIVALCSVAAGMMVTKDFSPAMVFLGTITLGGLCGLVNGGLTTGLKLLPFIVTLGTMQIFRGAAKLGAKGSPVNLPFEETAYKPWMGGSGIPWGIWLMILLVILCTLALRYTRFGRHIFAIGSNENTATLCGVNVPLTKILVYVIGGAMAGLSGIMLMAKSNQGDPTTAVGMELDVIASVVIGGASLSGGQGTVLGALIGALLMTTIRLGCNLNGIPPAWTEVITGVIIIVAVIIDRLRQRKA